MSRVVSQTYVKLRKLKKMSQKSLSQKFLSFLQNTHQHLAKLTHCTTPISPDPTDPVDPPPPPPNKWEFKDLIDIPPVRQLDRSTGSAILDQLEMRMPKNHPYRDADIVTWAHETTHGMNANIRNSNLAQIGVYLSSRYAATLPRDNPGKVSLKAIAEVAPQSIRETMSYKTYVIMQQQYWNNQPYYVYDEWSGYLIGSEVAVEQRKLNRFITVEYMLEMCLISVICCKLFADRKHELFCNHLMERTGQALTNAMDLGFESKILQKFLVDESAINFLMYGMSFPAFGTIYKVKMG